MSGNQVELSYTPAWLWWWLDYTLVSANIVTVVLLFLTTLPAEAPLKRGLLTLGLVKWFRYYLTTLTVFALQFIVVALVQLVLVPVFSADAERSMNNVNDTLWRIEQAIVLVLLSIPTRYIWTLMLCDENPADVLQFNVRRKQKLSDSEAAVAVGDKNPLLLQLKSEGTDLSSADVSTAMDDSSSTSSKKLPMASVSSMATAIERKKLGLFSEFEQKATAYSLQTWLPFPAEFLELTRFYSLFARVTVHGIKNVPRARPALIIMNHALGHIADVPMMIHILRTYAEVTPRFLISPGHFNVPIWSDFLFKLGCAPRTRLSAEALMRCQQTIVVFGARREKRYVELKTEKQKKRAQAPSELIQGSLDDDSSADESDAEVEETFMVWDSTKQVYLDLAHKYNYLVVPTVCVAGDDVFSMIHNLPSAARVKKRETIAQPFKKLAERTAFHLRFGDQIDINESVSAVCSTPRFGSGEEVSFCMSKMVRAVDDSPKQRQSGVYRVDSRRHAMHERRWSRELKLQMRTAVEDAMSDSILEMYTSIKEAADEKQIKTMQESLRKMTGGAELIPGDIRSGSDSEAGDSEDAFVAESTPLTAATSAVDYVKKTAKTAKSRWVE